VQSRVVKTASWMDMSNVGKIDKTRFPLVSPPESVENIKNNSCGKFRHITLRVRPPRRHLQAFGRFSCFLLVSSISLARPVTTSVMSISLLTRRLSSGLRIVPRAIGQPLPQTIMASISGTSTHQATLPCTAINIHSLPLQRHFSSTPNALEDSDDGGSITSTFSTMTNAELYEMSTIPGWSLVHNPPRRNTPRGALVGTVVSDKMQKTVNVAVDRYRIVPKYRKRLRYTKKFMAHDEFEVCNMGDLVMIVPCQKISRHKHFMVREIIRPKGQL